MDNEFGCISLIWGLIAGSLIIWFAVVLISEHPILGGIIGGALIIVCFIEFIKTGGNPFKSW